MTFDDHQAADILYGVERRVFDPAHREGGEIERDGRGAFNGRPQVSGVLFGGGIHPWTLAETWPRLWENPDAEAPLFEWTLPGTPASRSTLPAH